MRAPHALRVLCLLAALNGGVLSAWTATAAEKPPRPLDVKIHGVDETLAAAVRARLTLTQYETRQASETQLRRLLARSDTEIRTALEAFGYYEAKVTKRLVPRGGGYTADFEIQAGPAVMVTASRVRVGGDGAELPAVKKAVGAFAPKIGERLDHATYERSKSAVMAALTDHGYLGAELETHRVEVTSAARSAHIDVAWEGGERHKFGDVRFSESQFPAEFMRRFVPFTTNDWFASDKLLELQQRLVNADYFSTVTVHARPDQAVDNAVPVDVELSAAKRNVYTGSVFFSTDTGAGVQGGFQRRWLNTRGHKLTTNVTAAQKLESADVSYAIPLPGTQRRKVTFGASYEDEVTDTSVSRNKKAVVNESRQWRGFTRSLGVQFLAGDFEIGDYTTGNSKLLFGEASLQRSKSDNPLFATRGWSVIGTARLSPANVVSDTQFVSLYFQAKWLRNLGTNSRLLTRGAFGVMNAEDFDMLPPDLRFFSGGDRTVRGFDYEGIGSRNEAGDIIGGDHLVEASAELEHYFLIKGSRNWGLALFADAGSAVVGSGYELNLGTGLGLRWKSPVGPVRIDIAYPVVTPHPGDWRVHITMGPDL